MSEDTSVGLTSSSIRARPASGLTGAAALLVVEIANSSLVRHGAQGGLYASFGVRELWVIDAVRLTTRVFRGRLRTAIAMRVILARRTDSPQVYAPETFALRLDELEFS